VNSQGRRLRTIELTITPYQTVLLWMKNALKGTYEEGPRQSPQLNARRTNARKSEAGESLTVPECSLAGARTKDINNDNT
jgi:hypothetical protein